MVFLMFMIPNCHVITIVFIHFHYKAVPAQFSQTLTSPARTVQGNLKVDFKLQRNWIVVAQCSRGICTFHIARSQGLLVLGHIEPPLSEIAQNAGENLIASLEAAVSHQVNLAIPWWWSDVSVEASTNVYQWTLAVLATFPVEEVPIKLPQTLCKPIDIPFLEIQAQSMVSKPICNKTIQHIQKNEWNQYYIIYIYLSIYLFIHLSTYYWNIRCSVHSLLMYTIKKIFYSHHFHMLYNCWFIPYILIYNCLYSVT